MEDESDHSPSFLGYDKMQWRYSSIKSMTWIILQVSLKVFKQQQEDNWIKKEKNVNQSFTNTYKPPLNTWTPILHSPMSRYAAWKMSIFQSNTMYESQFCFIVLKVPWTARRSNQLILKQVSPEYSLEGLMLKLQLQYFGHLMWRADALKKTLMLGKIEGTGRRGWQRIRWLDGHEFEQALRVDDGQGSLTCCSPWGCKELDTTEQVNWNTDVHLWF